jgi:adenosylmethionine-8-amino-7-oxononanoate aminotransferase
VAAFIAEPVQGAGGVIVPPSSYWPLVRQVCDKYGVLLIADEVVTGFGRTGSLFGVRGWGVKPDFMCFAKGLSSGYVPLAATVFNGRVAEAFEANADFAGAVMHGYTYAGHPVGCAAAVACLDIVLKENLPDNAGEQGAYLLEALQPFVERYEAIGEVRGKGLMLAIDLVNDKQTRESISPMNEYAYTIAGVARQHGAIVRPVGTKIILSPPLVMQRPEIDLIVSALDAAFKEVLFTR